MASNRFISPELQAQPPDFDYDSFELPENVALDFYLNNHLSAADLPEPRQLQIDIRSADGVIVESVANSDPAVYLNQIAKGDHKVYMNWKRSLADGTAAQYDGWVSTFYDALYNSRTAATSIEVQAQHPVMRTFIKSSGEYYDARIRPKTDEEAVALQGLAQVSNAAYRQRDQASLQNLKPRLDDLSQRAKLFRLKREQGPAHVRVYYGATHQSLVDALAHKNELTPTEGFSVSIDPRSDHNNLNHAIYANYLRTGSIPDQLLLQDVARTLVGNRFLSTGRMVDRPLTDVWSEIDTLIDGKSIAEVRALRDELS